MKVDLSLIFKDPTESRDLSAWAERAGFDGVWATESTNDPFLQSFAAIMPTERVDVGTAIVVAFARTPMTVAYPAWDLAGVSNGRFRLGLGSQVRAHVEKRFSMPWSNPVERMRDFVLALRAIFHSWRTDERLSYSGEFYTHKLMSPVFTPGKHDFDIPISIAAVGPRMTKLVGEVCDGMIVHGFTTVPYFDKLTRPTVDEGLQAAGRDRSELEMFLPLFMIMGDTDEQLEDMTRKTREQIAFYGSTPQYRPVLEAVGAGDLQADLNELAKRGEWAQMAELIPSDVVEAFAVSGRPEDMPDLVKARWGDRVDRVSSYFGWPTDDPDRLREIAERFHNA